jgi:hypothetical protein
MPDRGIRLCRMGTNMQRIQRWVVGLLLAGAVTLPLAAHAQRPVAQGQAVVIFRDGQFAGPSQILWPGRYDIGQIAIGNDQLSSLRIPPGWVVTLYEHGGSQGRSRQFQGDTPWVGNDFNDITSAILVEAPNPGPGEHRHHDHDGDRDAQQHQQQPPPAPPPPPEDLTGTNLHVAHRVWHARDPIVLDYFNMPEGEAFAWVTVVKRGARDGEWGTWSYTSGAVNGSFTVGALPPGEYEARAFTADGGDTPLDRVVFQVAR